jgi:hypothetical protein
MEKLAYRLAEDLTLEIVCGMLLHDSQDVSNEKLAHSIGSFDVTVKGLNSNSGHTTYAVLFGNFGNDYAECSLVCTPIHVIPFTAHRMSDFMSPMLAFDIAYLYCATVTYCTICREPPLFREPPETCAPRNPLQY